jgi:ankyrin repeat protein
MIAAKRGKLSVVRVLLDAGANPNIALHKIACRALHTAAQEGHTSVVAELIDKGAEIDAATEYGETALISAAFAGQSSACQLLLDRGADPRATDSKGNTAARWAAKKGHYKLAFTLWRATRALRPTASLKSFGTGLDADKLSSSSHFCTPRSPPVISGR